MSTSLHHPLTKFRDDACNNHDVGSEFFTPRCIVRLLVKWLGLFDGRFYDPRFGSACMFLPRFFHGGKPDDGGQCQHSQAIMFWSLKYGNSRNYELMSKPALSEGLAQ